jgi:anti-sigma regulatory factor (Ser/Thr protein kinase)/GNAT superfamily N-acetyltransferase
METKCQFSKLTIPAEVEYADVAGNYAGGIAKLIGFDDEDRRKIELGVGQAVSQIIRYSFDSGEMATLDVSCERVPEGLKVAIEDKGLPLDPNRTQTGECEVDPAADSSELLCIEDYMDEVQFHNLGREGKETILIKHLRHKSITDYYEACELEPYARPSAAKPTRPKTLDCNIRAMKPSEAVEVSKAVYRAYGYTYGYELLYYPEQLAAANESGQVLSAVAVVNQDEIAGHCALIMWDKNSRIAEMGQGAVKPEYRGQGCFVKLTGWLIEQAKARGLTGIFGQAVTNHTYSQQVGHRFGLKDSALLVGFIPATVNFKEMAEALTQRGSLVIHFKYLEQPQPMPLYVPEHHSDMIGKLYQNIGVSPEFSKPAGVWLSPQNERSEMNIKSITSLNFGLVEIVKYGSGVVEEVRSTLRDLCLKKTDVINLHLDLADPATFHLTAEFEKLGFFFAGILPAAAHKGDALILQYLNNVPIDYDQIHVASDIGKELIAYIRARDLAVRTSL